MNKESDDYKFIMELYSTVKSNPDIYEFKIVEHYNYYSYSCVIKSNEYDIIRSYNFEFLNDKNYEIISVYKDTFSKMFIENIVTKTKVSITQPQYNEIVTFFESNIERSKKEKQSNLLKILNKQIK